MPPRGVRALGVGRRARRLSARGRAEWSVVVRCEGVGGLGARLHVHGGRRPARHVGQHERVRDQLLAVPRVHRVQQLRRAAHEQRAVAERESQQRVLPVHAQRGLRRVQHRARDPAHRVRRQVLPAWVQRGSSGSLLERARAAQKQRREHARAELAHAERAAERPVRAQHNAAHAASPHQMPGSSVANAWQLCTVNSPLTQTLLSVLPRANSAAARAAERRRPRVMPARSRQVCVAEQRVGGGLSQKTVQLSFASRFHAAAAAAERGLALLWHCSGTPQQCAVARVAAAVARS